MREDRAAPGGRRACGCLAAKTPVLVDCRSKTFELTLRERRQSSRPFLRGWRRGVSPFSDVGEAWWYYRSACLRVNR
jgi:hypothetical protein